MMMMKGAMESVIASNWRDDESQKEKEEMTGDVPLK